MFTVNGVISFLSALGVSYIFLYYFVHLKWFINAKFYFAYILIVIVLDAIMLKQSIPFDIFEGISIGLFMGLYFVAVKKTNRTK